MFNQNIIKKNLKIITFISILAVYILPIFYKGLFFSEEYKGVFFWSIISLFLAAAVGMFDGKMNLKFTCIHFSVLIIIAGYVASYEMAIFPNENIFQIKRYLMFLVAVVSSYLFFTNKKRQMLMLSAIYFMGVFIGIISIDYFAERKFICLINDILHFFNVYDTSILHRFPMTFAAGVFQYSNLYASYTMIVFFIGIGLIYSDINKYLKFIVSSTMFLQMYLFILTLSRGGYLVWGTVFILFYAFYKGKRSELLIRLISIVVPCFALLFITYNSYIYRDIPVDNIWIKTLGAFLISIAITLLYEYIRSSKNERFGKLLQNPIFRTAILTAAGFVVVFVGGLIARHILKGNYVTIDSIRSRGYYIRIWVDLIKQSPAVGYGANSWQVLSGSYNFDGYIYSRFPHSYLLKTIIEIGLFGAFALIMLIYVQLKVIVNNVFLKDNYDIIKYVLSFVTLGVFVHSSIDFIFVYGYIMMLYFLFLTFVLDDGLLKSFRKKC